MNRTWDVGLLVLRVVPASLLIVYHGWRKLLSAVGYVVSGQEWKFVQGVGQLGFPLPAFFAVAAALAESFGAAFLIVGLFTRYAALLLAFNMSVAVYRHLTSDFKYELAALYFLIFLAFVFLPPGHFSIDAKRK